MSNKVIDTATRINLMDTTEFPTNSPSIVSSVGTEADLIDGDFATSGTVSNRGTTFIYQLRSRSKLEDIVVCGDALTMSNYVKAYSSIDGSSYTRLTQTATSVVDGKKYYTFKVVGSFIDALYIKIVYSYITSA